MQDEFSNRLGMFQTAGGTRNSPTDLDVRFRQPPWIFTATADQAFASLADLETFARQQGRDITGTSTDKRREETQLENVAQPRDRFDAVEGELEILDHLILQFNTTDPGRSLDREH